MSSDPLWPFYERARDRLRECEPITFIAHAIAALDQVQASGLTIMHQYQPWNILLALKWALQEASPIFLLQRPATHDDLHYVLNAVHELEGNVPMPNDYAHVSLFMRHLAFQQFWLQRGASGEALARQELLFGALPENHNFVRDLHRLTGLWPRDFIDLAYGLVALLLKANPPPVIREEYFVTIEGTFPDGSVTRFFASLSKSVAELHDWLTGGEFQRLALADQLILPTPLLEYPLMRAAPRAHRVIFPPLVLRSLETFIYRILRSSDPEQFGGPFGRIFENYVRRCIEDSGTSFEDEASLRARLGSRGKCVDFLIEEANATIFIDAKGVEMSPRGRVSQDAGLVLGAIKGSAIKAVEQGIATAVRMDAANRKSSGQPGTERFLLVITFDDLYLGSSGEFELIFGSQVVPSLNRRFGTRLPILLHHVFFITISEFESLLAIVRQERCSVAEILRYARDQDVAAQSRKFHFQQHLHAFCSQHESLPMLESALNRIVGRCVTRAKGAMP